MISGEGDRHIHMVLSVRNIEICKAKLVKTELLLRLEEFSTKWIGKPPFSGCGSACTVEMYRRLTVL